jgi:N6-L-threonylcarbamoyladenine synthase
VPELASRSHIEQLPGVIRRALAEAGLSWTALDGVAVTCGPGLASSLLAGISLAKGLALALGKPLVGVNHIAAHIYSAFLAPGAPAPAEATPLLALVVSGGHTLLARVTADRRCRVIGQTLDDAAGEAFDKGARLLGLGYPGGPAIEQAARRARAAGGGNPPAPAAIFPRGRIRPGNPALGDLHAALCFSFSGLKTALARHLRQRPPADEQERDALAAAYQEAIVDALAERCDQALRDGHYAALAAGGGVTLNSLLRERLRTVAAARGVPLLLPEPRFCGDNAAMIAALAADGGGLRGAAADTLDAMPGLSLE